MGKRPSTRLQARMARVQAGHSNPGLKVVFNEHTDDLLRQAYARAVQEIGTEAIRTVPSNTEIHEKFTPLLEAYYRESEINAKLPSRAETVKRYNNHVAPGVRATYDATPGSADVKTLLRCLNVYGSAVPNAYDVSEEWKRTSPDYYLSESTAQRLIEELQREGRLFYNERNWTYRDDAGLKKQHEDLSTEKAELAAEKAKLVAERAALQERINAYKERNQAHKDNLAAFWRRAGQRGTKQPAPESSAAASASASR